MRLGTVVLSRGRLLAVAAVFVEDSERDLVRFDAKVDTGFTEWLGLPAKDIEVLGLEVVGMDVVLMANNEERSIEVYSANVVWGLQHYNVRVHRVGTMPLIGMSLLHRHVMTMDARNGGAIEIMPGD